MVKPISCDLHDYLEIACIYHYELKVTLRNGTSLVGIARTTLTLPSKEEVLQLDTHSEVTDVFMHELAQVDVLTARAKFQTLSF